MIIKRGSATRQMLCSGRKHLLRSSPLSKGDGFYVPLHNRGHTTKTLCVDIAVRPLCGLRTQTALLSPQRSK
jgi:hypothetical protein